MNIKLILITIIILFIAFVTLGIKIFFGKKVTLQHHCTSEQSKKKESCICSGDKENCRYRSIHHPEDEL